MYRAKLYSRTNQLQQRDVRNVLNKFSHLIDWKNKNSKTLLDVGCGVGNILAEDLQNLMPNTYELMVGVDLSDQMIFFANQKYATDKIKFFQRDIVNFIEIERMKTFDHVTSFFCFNWIRNQSKGLRQIYDLLNPGGDFISITVAWSCSSQLFTKLSKTEKWRPYMPDVENFVSYYYNSKKPEEDFKLNLEKAGFHSVITEHCPTYYRCKNLQELKDLFETLNPFSYRLSPEMKNELFEEFCNRDVNEVEDPDHRINSFQNFHYNNIIGYAKK